MKLNRNPILRAIAVAAAAFAVLPSQAAGISADPGDYTALPAGTSLLLGYYQHLTADDAYAKGQKQPGKLGLTVDVGLARYVHYTSAFGMAASYQAIVPYVSQKLDITGGKVSGLGNTIFGATLYPIADLANNEHLGFTLFVTPSTGSHKSDAGVQVSPDRLTTNLQVGYIKGLSPSLTLDANAQVEMYGKEKTSNIKQDAYTQLDTTLRYNLSPATQLSGTVRFGMGGDITGAGNEKKNTLVGTFSTFLTPTLQAMVQYTQDINVDSSVKLKGVQTRLMYIF